MKIYNYWAQTSGNATTADGQTWWLTKWGGSNVSEADARDSAAANFAGMQERLARDEHRESFYYVGSAPLREKVIERFGDADHPYAAITRNRYGALVLNTQGVFIADVDANVDMVDLHEKSQAIIQQYASEIKSLASESSGFFQKLFGKAKSSGVTHERLEAQQRDLERLLQEEIADEKAAVLRRLAEFHEKNSTVSFRVYETAAGFRVIVTNQTLEATGDESADLLEALDSDPMYRRLCRRQECYRARLTPKPWRVPGVNAPRFNPDGRILGGWDRREWLKDYERGCSEFTVCKLVERYGDEADLDRAIAKVLAVHDEYVLSETVERLA